MTIWLSNLSLLAVIYRLNNILEKNNLYVSINIHIAWKKLLLNTSSSNQRL